MHSPQLSSLCRRASSQEMQLKSRALLGSCLLITLSIAFLFSVTTSKLPSKLRWNKMYNIQDTFLNMKMSAMSYLEKEKRPTNEKFSFFDWKKKEIKPLCKNQSLNLAGQTSLDYRKLDKLSDTIRKKVQMGGFYEPDHCIADTYTAIVIPFRDRMLHLYHFLHHYHPLLQRQNIGYKIFVVSQMDDQSFNRGMLMNIGYVEAKKSQSWDCFVFHDVDHLLENDHLIYKCYDNPAHYSTSIEKFGYTKPYTSFFGGVCALTEEQMEKINGYPNMYWGWGGEDDDIAMRIVNSGYKVNSLPPEIGRYATHKHPQAKASPSAGTMFETWRSRWHQDGLQTLNYDVLAREEYPLYTQINVRLNSNPLITKPKESKSD